MKTEIKINLSLSFSGDIAGQEQAILQDICEAIQRQIQEVGLVPENSQAYTTMIHAKEEGGEAKYMSIL